MSQYKEILDKIIFSYSSLSQYDECPYGFYMNKIEKIKGDGNAYSEIGGFAHGLHADYLSGKSTLEEVLTECVETFDDHITYEISESSKEKKYMALCEYIAGFDEEDFNNRFEILAVEKRIYWKIDGHRMIGIVDLVVKDKNTNKIYLVDHKSSSHFLKKDGKPLKNTEESYNKYKKQMYMYADAMKNSKDFGYYPDYIVWNHFLDDGKLTVIPFNEKDYKETIDWVKDTVDRIYADEEFMPHVSYMMCNQLCNYRDGYCEYMLIEDEDE